MRERKYVKFRTDMYEDTKFKIIDMKPEKDLIHYIWTRLVVLAGKVNLEGELYLSRTIPYTIETLAIEFNRDVNQVKLALDTFIELEMMEIIEENIYKVKNFAKHQNIKVKDKNKNLSKEVEIKKDLKEEVNNIKDKEIEEKSIINEKENLKKQEMEKRKLIELKVANEDTGDNDHNNRSIAPLEVKRNNVANKKKKKEGSSHIIELAEEKEDNSIVSLNEGDYKLGPGERILKQFAFD
ncbi:phage replisome organizer N-terminal domain-containing protein [Clostridium sp.]|uniref:phage replisome organizer N-terminal domain-containing protein n=1 Tax=Clostridium sp. TaxID=1506 RepID=UPI002606ED55|nr:phage replisome organizer N-terminal domain-containing protein [Clostridium sp.]